MNSQTTDVLEDEPPETMRRTGRSDSGIDTGRWMRIGAGALGGLLLVRGLRRRGLRGLVLAGAGGWLVSRTLRGGKRSGGAVEQVGTSRHHHGTGAPPGALEVEQSITIEKAADELYDQWRDPETHEQMWAHFAEVDWTGEDRQHWSVGGPMDLTLEWDAEVVEDEPGEFLRWESLEGATAPNEGSVRFESRDDQETEVVLRMRFDSPGGRLSTVAAKRLDVVPEAAAGKALRRFKSLAETGEIPTLEGNPSARGQGDLI